MENKTTFDNSNMISKPSSIFIEVPSSVGKQGEPTPMKSTGSKIREKSPSSKTWFQIPNKKHVLREDDVVEVAVGTRGVFIDPIPRPVSLEQKSLYLRIMDELLEAVPFVQQFELLGQVIDPNQVTASYRIELPSLRHDIKQLIGDSPINNAEANPSLFTMRMNICSLLRLLKKNHSLFYDTEDDISIHTRITNQKTQSKVSMVTSVMNFVLFSLIAIVNVVNEGWITLVGSVIGLLVSSTKLYTEFKQRELSAIIADGDRKIDVGEQIQYMIEMLTGYNPRGSSRKQSYSEEN